MGESAKMVTKESPELPSHDTSNVQLHTEPFPLKGIQELPEDANIWAHERIPTWRWVEKAEIHSP